MRQSSMIWVVSAFIGCCAVSTIVSCQSATVCDASSGTIEDDETLFTFSDVDALLAFRRDARQEALTDLQVEALQRCRVLVRQTKSVDAMIRAVASAESLPPEECARVSSAVTTFLVYCNERLSRVEVPEPEWMSGVLQLTLKSHRTNRAAAEVFRRDNQDYFWRVRHDSFSAQILAHGMDFLATRSLPRSELLKLNSILQAEPGGVCGSCLSRIKMLEADAADFHAITALPEAVHSDVHQYVVAMRAVLADPLATDAIDRCKELSDQVWRSTNRLFEAAASDGDIRVCRRVEGNRQVVAAVVAIRLASVELGPSESCASVLAKAQSNLGRVPNSSWSPLLECDPTGTRIRLTCRGVLGGFESNRQEFVTALEGLRSVQAWRFEVVIQTTGEGTVP